MSILYCETLKKCLQWPSIHHGICRPTLHFPRKYVFALILNPIQNHYIYTTIDTIVKLNIYIYLYNVKKNLYTEQTIKTAAIFCFVIETK